MADLAEHDRIKLHIGAHRTGTTSLQAALHAHRQSLSARGVGYWGPSAMRAKRFPGVFRWFKGPTLTPAEQGACEIIATENIPLLSQRLRNQRHLGHEKIIISDENILGDMKINLQTKALYPDAAHRLALFSRIFGPYISRISLTIRSYDSYWRSLLAHQIAKGGAAPTAQMLDALATQPKRWLDVVADVQTAFPEAEIRVMRFEDWIAAPNAQIEAVFGAPLGLPTRVAARLNPSKNKAHLHRILLKNGHESAAKKLGADDEPYLPFSPAHIAQMQADYRSDVAELQQGQLARVRLLKPAETS